MFVIILCVEEEGELLRDDKLLDIEEDDKGLIPLATSCAALSSHHGATTNTRRGLHRNSNGEFHSLASSVRCVR